MKLLASLLLGVAALAGFARADCGSIPFKPWVDVFEPNQRAVIAFNGVREILLLSTDLRASEPTKVLEVIPFPSEPKVGKGNVEAFAKATEIINRKLFPRKYIAGEMKGFGGMGGMGGGAAELPPAGHVAMHKRIGAHDISVVKVLDSRRFIAWVEDYLTKQGVDNPKIPGPLRPVIAEYLRDNCEWFAFNVVELGTETVSKEAIQYKFKTRYLYYPLRITRAEKGDTTVRLLLISPRLLRIPNLGRPKVSLVHRPVRINYHELYEIDGDMRQMLGKSNNLLRIWEIKGRLSGFKRDVMTTWY